MSSPTNPRRRRLLGGLGGLALGGLPLTGCTTEPTAAPTNDTATEPVPLRERGFDEATLLQAVARAGAEDQLHSLIIARHGEIHVAERFRGPGIERIANVKSVSKTLIAALVGAAMDRGILAGPEQRVAPLLGPLVPVDADPRVREITVGHLLTMRAGLERTSGPNYGRWVSSPHWVRFILSRPFVAEPGGRFLYSTGSFHLLSAVLTRVTGRSTLVLARDWLGEPLGIEIPPWTRDPQGIYMGGNNMGLTPRGMYRFGELYRRGGEWQGERVLSENWIRASWQARSRSPWSGDQYGYGWFLTELGGEAVRYARGYGGQMIYVVPRPGIVVVVTSDPDRPARSGGYVGTLHGIVGGGIIPAAADRKRSS